MPAPSPSRGEGASPPTRCGATAPPPASPAAAGPAGDGFRLLGLSWQPELSAGASPTDVAAVFARTHELLGVELEHLYCPHPAGPPVCWCRKPLPGLAVALIERHRLDPARCLYLGSGRADAAFARQLGVPFQEAGEPFGAAGAQP